jgi:hypothetical protein
VSHLNSFSLVYSRWIEGLCTCAIVPVVTGNLRSQKIKNNWSLTFATTPRPLICHPGWWVAYLLFEFVICNELFSTPFILQLPEQSILQGHLTRSVGWTQNNYYIILRLYVTLCYTEHISWHCHPRAGITVLTLVLPDPPSLIAHPMVLVNHWAPGDLLMWWPLYRTRRNSNLSASLSQPGIQSVFVILQCLRRRCWRCSGSINCFDREKRFCVIPR